MNLGNVLNLKKSLRNLSVNLELRQGYLSIKRMIKYSLISI